MARRVRTRAGAHTRSWSVPTFPLSIWLLGLLALAVALLPFLRGPAQVAESRPDGYSSIVTAAIERAWLYPVPNQGGEGGDVDGRVSACAAATCRRISTPSSRPPICARTWGRWTRRSGAMTATGSASIRARI
jgi:hypothetical protein